ncbi:sensor histidine kinase [Deinococcus humi]|uniref:histidine kinase n=1 Tax=Deinococcus humi TaxID=662880 RepID=A0A7W8JZ12_9DEIO|nr:ATP-binding protein [Deinococcus humi]MBB5365825.1 signal transduction histidine kinase [Deinococcus humi]GGO39369.1 hypothetical protein GCM10008949_47370 [Deinococcus humi]
MTPDPAPEPAEHEMPALIQGFDWAATPLGPREDWPISLRVVTELLLAQPLPMIVLWGPELIQIYNDGYRIVMGDKHPAGLGQPNQACWPEVWDFNRSIFEGVLTRGETFTFTDQPLALRPSDPTGPGYFTLNFSPVKDDHGAVGGVLAIVTETTARVRAAQQAELHRITVERRNATLEAFAVLTRDLGLETDALTLIRRVQEVVLPLLAAGFVGYYVPEDGLWRIKVQVGLASFPELQAAVDAGFPFETTPNLLIPWRSGQAHYQDVYDPAADQLLGNNPYPQATATLPVRVNGQVQGVLGFALNDTRVWSSVDRAVLGTVERSLTLALERLEQTRHAEQQRAALQAANEELEAFAYSVSHDLRAPVRHIQGFSGLLRKGMGSQLDLKASHYLGVIDEAAGRMNVLIDAMLELSRAARLPLRLGTVDLEALVLRSRQDLEMEAQGRAVQWRVTPLPLVTGDQDTLQQVVSNLLSNAVKYTRPRETAVIEVWAEAREGAWAVFVRDNGVGFDPQYQDKLFGVFQRLHLEREFEGTGVGLANVRRIIARHGGTVSAQGVLGEGATFGFTLPR